MGPLDLWSGWEVTMEPLVGVGGVNGISGWGVGDNGTSGRVEGVNRTSGRGGRGQQDLWSG